MYISVILINDLSQVLSTGNHMCKNYHGQILPLRVNQKLNVFLLQKKFYYNSKI